MKKLILLMAVTLVLGACGAKNKVNSGAAAPKADEVRQDGYEANVNFEGDYYLVDNRDNSGDCSRMLDIRRECGGYIVKGNNHLAPEEFCNVNRGDSRSTSVTQVGNELKSVVNVGPNRTYTNVLKIDEQGYLGKFTRLKSRDSQCLYKKR